jgi:tetraacyldisaccharide 4'-kinase
MLRILGSTYGSIGRLRAAMYQRGWLSCERLDSPVVSIGGLSVGGAGKTPTTALVASLLREDGLRVAILSRGYRRSGTEPLLISKGDGNGPRVDVTQSGDEPFWLASVLPSVPVAVAARREEAARLVSACGPCDVFVLDDGFQHLRVARDADVLVVNPEAPFWDDAPMPSGRLREDPQAANRADGFLVVGNDPGTHDILDARYSGRPHFALVRQSLTCWPARDTLPQAASRSPETDGAALPQGPAFALAGIARPGRFFDDIRDQGIDLRGTRRFADHHAFSATDLQEVERAARAAGAQYLLTTEKDSVRLPGASTDLPLWVWGYRLEASQPDKLVTWLRQQAGISPLSDAA